MKYHVSDEDDFQYASEAELTQDLATADAELKRLDQAHPASYEEGQELERAKESVDRRIEMTLTELRRR